MKLLARASLGAIALSTLAVPAAAQTTEATEAGAPELAYPLTPQGAADFIAAAVKLASDDNLRRTLAGNAHRAMQALHPEQVAADFDALLAGLADSRKAHASLAIA